MRPGKHTLIQIPRGQPAENALLDVEAKAVRLGNGCTEIYFQELNLTGAWVEAKWTGGLHFHAKDVNHGKSDWKHVGQVDVKVAHGHTLDGTQYLNIYFKHLGHVRFAVGGLLGEDDHTEAAKPSGACVRRHMSI
jgi:hypothetical protein